MRKEFIIILLMLFSTTVSAKEINYTPKLLVKELQKTWEVNFNALIEVPSYNDKYLGNGKFYKVVKNNIIVGYVFVGRVNSCRLGGCSAEPVLNTADDSEYFDVFMLISENKIVECVRVFNYQATHGQEVCSKGWLKQFNTLPADKNFDVGDDIDSISGATISVYAITNEVNKILAVLN